jgi:hypothetical protein
MPAIAPYPIHKVQYFRCARRETLGRALAVPLRMIVEMRRSAVLGLPVWQPAPDLSRRACQHHQQAPPAVVAIHWPVCLLSGRSAGRSTIACRPLPRVTPAGAASVSALGRLADLLGHSVACQCRLRFTGCAPSASSPRAPRLILTGVFTGRTTSSPRARKFV